jgi:hypothetical protein
MRWPDVQSLWLAKELDALDRGLEVMQRRLAIRPVG